MSAGQVVYLIAKYTVKKKHADRQLPVDQIVQDRQTAQPRNIVAHRQCDIQIRVHRFLIEIHHTRQLKQTGRANDLQAIFNADHTIAQVYPPLNLIIRQPGTGQVIAKPQAPHDSIEVNDTDQSQSTVGDPSTLSKAPIMHLQIDTAIQAQCRKIRRTTIPMQARIKLRSLTLNTGRIAKRAENQPQVGRGNRPVEDTAMHLAVVNPAHLRGGLFSSDLKAAQIQLHITEAGTSRI